MLLIKIKKWLNKPFPGYPNIKYKIGVPILFGIFVSAFLFIFKPFGIDISDNFQVFRLIIAGTATTIIMLFYSLIFPLFFPKFCNYDNWNIKRHTIYILLHFILIAIANSFIAYFFGDSNNRDSTLFFLSLESLAQTITIGSFPVLALTFLLERMLFKKNQKTAQTTTEKINLRDKITNKLIKISSQNNKEIIETNNSDFLYIKSDGNYCTVFIKNAQKIKKKIIRATLKKIENDFSQNAKIVRCHKSYIINLDKVKEVTGNARGYSFFIDEIEFSIPVSRNFSKDLFQHIRN